MHSQKINLRLPQDLRTSGPQDFRTSGPQDQWPSFYDLLKAYRSCRLKKKANSSQSRFEEQLGQNLLQLQKEIHNGTYRPSPMKCFIVDEPKPREIFAADFRDRVVHHLVIAVMEPIWEKSLSIQALRAEKKKECTEHSTIFEIK